MHAVAHHATCPHCGSPMEDWGAHGLVCPRCAEGEEGAFDVGDYRQHFARGYREGERDVVAGMPRALVAAEGDDPPVVKSEDHSYYHGYKAAVEGKAVDESSAWSAYVAKHALRSNGYGGHYVVEIYNEGASRPEDIRGRYRTEEDAEAAAEHVRRVARDRGWNKVVRVRHMPLAGQTPNPLHLSLDGNFSFGIGTKDDEEMQRNQSRLDAAKIKDALAYVHYWESRERGAERRLTTTAYHEAVKATGLNRDEAAVLARALNLHATNAGGGANVASAMIRGIEAVPVSIEAAPAADARSIRVVGLDERHARETQVRVLSALTHIGVEPDIGATVHVQGPEKIGGLAAAQLDLPVAIAILAMLGRVPEASLRGLVAIGELSLDGSLRPVRGGAVVAKIEDASVLLVPADNEPEARFSGRIPVAACGDLSEVVAYLQEPKIPRDPPVQFSPCPAGLGQRVQPTESMSKALELALDGHNVLLVGPPGAGKTMTARFIHSELPPLSVEEARELTLIHSAAGLLDLSRGYVCARPFRAPHHSVSEAGMIGGGAVVRPGEVSLADHGVLFLDEATEFHRGVIEAVARAVRDGRVGFSRSGAFTAIPAMPLVIAAVNPCPCGYLGTPRCRCSALALASHEERLRNLQASFAMHRVDVEPISVARLAGRYEGNARKNVSAVIDAFAEGRRHSEKTCSTDGARVYSYSMLIAARVDAEGEPTKGPGRVLVLDTRESPSSTTSSQINAVRAAFRDAEIVTEFPHGAVYSPNDGWKDPETLIDTGESLLSYAPGTATLSLTKLTLGKPRRLRRVFAIRMGVDERGIAKGGLHWVSANDPAKAEDEWFRFTGRRVSLSEYAPNGALTEGTCDVCGEPFEIITATGVANHVTPDGDVDYDADADHVPYEGAMAANGRQYATEWYQPLDLATVTQILGADHVAQVLGREHPAGYAESRAAGWWDANDPDHHNAYASLARMIRAGDLDDMIAEARGRR